MAEEKQTPLLILVVDEDDDVGVKAKAKSPIIGREKNFEAALKLVMADPEDADANAMFAAIKIFDEAAGNWSSGVEVATVTGKRNGGLESDLKITREIEDLIQRLGAKECIIVSDGPLSPSISSIITSRLRVVSFRNVIVKQSQTIETSWMLFLRYLRMVVYESSYARTMLGIPGLIILVLGTLYFYNLLSIPLILIFIGAALLIRGFGIDTAFGGLMKRIVGISSKPGLIQIRIFTAVVGLILIVVSLIAGVQAALSYVQSATGVGFGSLTLEHIIAHFNTFMGILIINSIDLIAVAAFLNTAYNIFYYHVMRSPRVWRHVQAMLIFFFLWIMIRLLGLYLSTQNLVYLIQLVLITLIGFATLLTSITIIRAIRGARRSKHDSEGS
ncbi:MAG: DUF373 family protein [Nitrososphaerota archaeon]